VTLPWSLEDWGAHRARAAPHLTPKVPAAVRDAEGGDGRGVGRLLLLDDHLDRRQSANRLGRHQGRLALSAPPRSKQLAFNATRSTRLALPEQSHRAPQSGSSAREDAVTVGKRGWWPSRLAAGRATWLLVKQYEPFFSATSDFEDEDAIVATGVTPIIHYDPLDRVIRTELPDGSESRVEFDVWQQASFDPNDSVVGTRWLTEHQAGTLAEQCAAALALNHANTPTIAHLDALGRTFLSQADNGPAPATPSGPHRLLDTRVELDIQGNTLTIIDARGNRTIEQTFDPLKRRIRVSSPDAGTRLADADVAGKPLRGWDSRGQTHRSRYDALHECARRLQGQPARDRAPTRQGLSRRAQLGRRGRPRQAF
jgi:hypothetical protein